MTKYKGEEFTDGDRVVYKRYTRLWDCSTTRPYREPQFLSYRETARTSHWDLNPDALPPPALGSGALPTQHAKNLAYAKLINSLNSVTATSKSGWGENLAQARDAVGMVSQRALQLAKFTKEISRGRFGDAARTLGVQIPKTIRRRWYQGRDGIWRQRERRARQYNWRHDANGLGSAWLEFHFGWAPLVSDIHDSVQTMTRANFDPSSRINGSSSQTGQGFTINTNDEIHVHWDRWQAYANEHMSASVSVSNPNAFLANQFGVVNPATLVWNLIPYSFVVDWFANVSQVLDSMTDFVGVSVTRSSHASFQRHTREIFDLWHHPDADGRSLGSGSQHYTVMCDRGTSLPLPELEVTMPAGLSPQRGATAISLLLQNLRSL